MLRRLSLLLLVLASVVCANLASAKTLGAAKTRVWAIDVVGAVLIGGAAEPSARWQPEKRAAYYGTASSNTLAAEGVGAALPELEISASRYPELAENIANALKAGHPDVLTHGGNIAANRAAALEGVPNIIGLSRDEFPFASAMEGGAGAWVGHIPAWQQNAQGALISNFLRGNGIGPGMQYRVIIAP